MYNNIAPEYEVDLERVEALRLELGDLFEIYDTALDQPRPGQVRFRGRFYCDPSDCFDELRTRFERHNFTPMIRQDGERMLLIGLPVVFHIEPVKWVSNLLLFIATIASTLFAGSLYGASSLEEALQIWRGWPFSLSIMAILTAHEFGHYFAARYHKVSVTLPYFIPFPLSIIGTMGAFIRLKGPLKNRRALLDVGASGPLAGFVLAVPIVLYGLATSDIGPLPPACELCLEGNSLLYSLAKIAVFGRMLPDVNGLDVQMNQVAFAGWVGLLVTALNLLPVGQLDGGHVAYVLFGKQARQFFWPIIISLALLALFSGATTWVIWIFLLFALGRVHAEPLDDVTQLDGRRRAIAIFTLILFILVFVPVPLQSIP